MKSYEALKKIYEDIHPFKQIQSLLDWDMRVMMPTGAVHERITLQQAIGQVIRATRETQQIDHLLMEAEGEREELFGWDKQNLDLIAHIRRVQNAVSPALSVRLEQIEPQCQTLWPQAKHAKDFRMIAPLFRELVALMRERGKAIGDALGCRPYEALLYSFTRGASEETINALFGTLRTHLQPILNKSAAVEAPLPITLDRGQQLDLCSRVMEKIGFDFRYGRIDASEKAYHKWTDADSRIAVNIAPDNFLNTVSSAIHETGHALHKRYRPEEWLTQPIGTPGDYCLREGMALIWQNYACRDKAFLDLLAAEVSHVAKQNVTAAELAPFITRSRASTMRIGHGDANYMMHIIMRYEIERDLINGVLDPDDLPDAWNKMVRDTLGLDVPDDGQGCLQDIHWYKGSFGYFPCYGLGHLYAAQLFAKAKRDIPDFSERYLADNAAVMIDFLSWHIYSKANSKPGLQIVEDALGAKLDPQYFIDCIKRTN